MGNCCTSASNNVIEKPSNHPSQKVSKSLTNTIFVEEL